MNTHDRTTITGKMSALRGSLHTRILFLIMAISLVSIVVIAAISIQNGQQLLKKDVGQRLNVIASDRMQAIKHIWDLRLEQTESLASNANIKTLLSSSSVTPEAESHAKEAVSGFEMLMKTKDTTYLAVSIADSTGKILVSDGQHKIQSLDNETIRRASIKPFYFITFDDDLHFAVLDTVAPVRANADEKTTPIGFVSVQRDLQTANSILASKLFLGNTGEVYLVDENGLMITDSRFVEGAKYNQVIDTIPVKECFANGADVIGALYTNYNGSVVFGASNCDRNSGILLISEVSRDEMFSSLKILQFEYLLMAGAIIAAAGATAFFLSDSILKPLQKLRVTIRKMQAGSFEKVDIARRDEIGELADSFNAMVEELGIKTKRIHLKNDILSFMSSRLQVQSDELKRIDKEKEEYSSMISHELKTFLVPIIGYSELLADGTLGELSATQKEKVLIMLERAWSLLYLTQNILDARELETKKLKMNIVENVPARTLLQECKNRALPLARSHNLELEIKETDGTLTLSCDSNRVLQVLDNLVNNAVRATPTDRQNRTIRLHAEKKDGQVVFSVKDSGVGIPMEMQAGIFRKFYESDKSLTRRSGGSGLGLAISKGIVEAHKGRIWFDSAPDVGSSFYFAIPQIAAVNKNEAAAMT